MDLSTLSYEELNTQLDAARKHFHALAREQARRERERYRTYTEANHAGEMDVQALPPKPFHEPSPMLKRVYRHKQGFTHVSEVLASLGVLVVVPDEETRERMRASILERWGQKYLDKADIRLAGEMLSGTVVTQIIQDELS